MVRLASRYCIRLAAAGLLALGLPAATLAGSIIYIGTWNGAPAGGNDTAVGGPGLATGQRYVISINYDNLSARTDGVDVLTDGFVPSGNTMSTIDLDAAGNSLEIFVPMEGLDAGSPFIYRQNESNHFPVYIPSPTLNFVDGSNIGDTANIIGLEFEGDFFAGAGNNFIEIFNVAPPGGTTNLVSQIINFGEDLAMKATNSLSEAVALTADAGAVVYNATTLTATTTSSSTNNDLGAARSDGEDFIDATWTESGGALTGVPAGPNGNDIAVDIVNSGLTSTINTVNWDLQLDEQMTGLSATDSAIVSYANTDPTLAASHTVMATGIDFNLSFDDADLIVNGLIANFESLVYNVLLDGTTDVTGFFSALFSAGPGGAGMQFETYAAMEAAFGLGMHSLFFSVTDLAGSIAGVTLNIDVLDSGQPPGVPLPATPLLLLIGLLGLAVSRSSRSHA